MKRVITYGTYDLLHVGHINLLKRAAALGDELYVGLSTDDFNMNMKDKYCIDTYEERKIIIESIRYVTKVFPEENWEQKVEDVRKYNIDVFVMGNDWEGKFDFLKSQCEVIYLPRTPDISSTNRKKILDALHLVHKRIDKKIRIIKESEGQN